MRVLLIEDEESTARSIEISLAAEGIICDTVNLGEEGVEAGTLYDYDLIILDLMLPDINGYEVLLRLRASKITTPVLILSGISSVDKAIKGLEWGADDYLTKPFNRGELIARVQAVVRRSKGGSKSVIRFGDISIDLGTRIVKVNEKQVSLPNKEYSSLELLVTRQGKVLTKEMFLDHLYKGRNTPKEKIVDVFICKLRKKLSDAANGTNYIDTVWGHGYMLK